MSKARFTHPELQVTERPDSHILLSMCVEDNSDRSEIWLTQKYWSDGIALPLCHLSEVVSVAKLAAKLRGLSEMTVEEFNQINKFGLSEAGKYFDSIKVWVPVQTWEAWLAE